MSHRTKPRAATCQRLGSTSAVHALLLRPDDTLVAGGDAGLLFVTRDATRSFGKKQSAPFRSVWALAENEGALFIGSTNGLFWGELGSFSEGRSKLQRASLVSGNLPDDWVTALLPHGDHLFVGTYNAGVVRFRYEAGALLDHGADATLGYVNPAGLTSVDANTLAIATMDGLRRGELGRTTRIATNARDVTAVVPAVGGGFWVGTRGGLEWHEALEP
jgi:ligand-binding sensor domain-containing protein